MCSGLETLVSSLEGGYGATLVGSVQAACSTVLLALLSPGDHVLVTRGDTPGPMVLSRHLQTRFGIEVEEVDTWDLGAVRAAMKPNTRLIVVETPARRDLRITDLAGIDLLARRGHALVMVDARLAGPFTQSPLALGAHLVVHALAPLAGDPGQEGAILVAKQGAVHKRLREMTRILGNRPELPALPGLATLALREERSQVNALALAEWLREQPQIKTVHHLGLEEHPDHELARQQMRGPGPGLSLELKEPRHAQSMLTRLRSFQPQPGSPGSIHLKVGFEDIQDLLEELSEGLKRLERFPPTGTGRP